MLLVSFEVSVNSLVVFQECIFENVVVCRLMTIISVLKKTDSSMRNTKIQEFLRKLYELDGFVVYLSERM